MSQPKTLRDFGGDLAQYQAWKAAYNAGRYRGPRTIYMPGQVVERLVEVERIVERMVNMPAHVAPAEIVPELVIQPTSQASAQLPGESVKQWRERLVDELDRLRSLIMQGVATPEQHQRFNELETELKTWAAHVA